jgi:hypothetical protein
MESTVVIPVNLKIGYESTMLSRRDGVIIRENRVKAPTFLPTSFPGSNFHLFSQKLPKIDGI